ncbi:MAG: hypothetical protein WCP92_02705 [bacterium]
MNIDFKNLSEEQEKKLNKLLSTMIEATKANINNVSVSPDTVTIPTDKGNITLTQMNKEIEELSPIGIEHLNMYFSTFESIMHIRHKKKSRF